ncbi:MAG: 3-dehydroquinate dehydratase [Paludibacteraceae bacterium]|nr:3-dehydroquinate dehydratase [Paludibacteraceae bacterium]
MNILVVNGPNLNLLGRRDPQQYGTRSMEQIILGVQHAHPDIYFTYRQSNHEGDLIDWLQETQADAVILNAGGYTHTSVSLRDAVELCNAPVIEVHLSDIKKREEFRRISLLTDVCATSIIGQDCYEKAVEYIIDTLH